MSSHADDTVRSHRSFPVSSTAGSAVAAVGLAVFAVLARVWPRSALWLDEAQSVAFARVPLGDLPAALRTDGAPPLYYLVLHAWMRLVGGGDHAVRSLSVVASVVALPLFFLALRRLGGVRFASVGVLLLAMNPFAIRYATETRMYALVVLLVVVGLLAVPALLSRPTPGRLVAVSAVVAALLWTHYWAIYLVGALVLCDAALATRAARRRDRSALAAAAALGAAVVLGVVAWMPWLGSFRYQAQHTGTPWTTPPSPLEMFRVVYEHAGGRSAAASAAGTLYVVAIVVGCLPRSAARRWLAPLGGSADDAPHHAHLADRSYVVALALLTAMAVPLAVTGAIVSGSAFAARYTSVFLPLTLALVAAGLARLRSTRALVAVLSLLAMLSCALVTREVRSERTPARTIAALLVARTQPGDVVLFCPDQVGPAVAREVRRQRGDRTSSLQGVPSVEMATFPAWAAPDRVDWVDYAARVEQAWPAAFAVDADQRAGSRSVWLVWSDGYPPTEASCRGVRRILERLRPAAQLLVEDQPWRHLDHAALVRFPPSERPRPSLASLAADLTVPVTEP